MPQASSGLAADCSARIRPRSISKRANWCSVNGNGARAVGRQDLLGKIRPGGYADLICVPDAPSAADVFRTDSEKLFEKHGRMIGEEVRALGFNVDFAPVFDLDSGLISN